MISRNLLLGAAVNNLAVGINNGYLLGSLAGEHLGGGVVGKRNHGYIFELIGYRKHGELVFQTFAVKKFIYQ